jgi:hypothetical protein
MAQTKTRGATKSGAAKSKARRKPAKANARKATAQKPRRTSRNGSGGVDSARKAVAGTAKRAGDTVSEAGQSVGKAASKAKAPLLAGGAAVAGAAGGLVLGARAGRRSKAMRRPKVKIRSRDIARAARDVGQFGMDVGQLASELRRNREQANGAKRRSPVEVVLDGLTHRGNGSDS